jgi:hypothetical protein
MIMIDLISVLFGMIGSPNSLHWMAQIIVGLRKSADGCKAMSLARLRIFAQGLSEGLEARNFH